MAIEIKDANGMVHEVPSKGMVGAGLGLGIAGTALGILNGGLGNGLFGNSTVTPNEVVAGAEALNAFRGMGDCCFVNKDTFYQNLLTQVNEQASRDIASERRFAALESAIATNAAVGECNRAAIQREFEVVDNRFAEEARYDELALRYAMCGTIKGDVSIPFSKLTMGCADKTHVIDTYEARPFREPRHEHGCGPCFGGF